MAIVFGVLIWVGYGLVALSKQRVNEQDPNILPSQFPRYHNCAGCKAGYKTDAEIESCMSPCFNLKYVHDWEKLGKEAGQKLVYLPSRIGPKGEPTVNISAWWMPPLARLGVDPRTAPRIVALHGLGANNNHCGVQPTCFLLRQSGFGCLAPSVRDYGLSGKSTHSRTLSWGYDYHLDLLGAWDYAVNDPQGTLGGALLPSQVGIMGFSKGALGTAIAFALEKAVPGAWLDSGPYCGLHGMIGYTIKPYAGPLTPLFQQPVWWGAKWFAETPLDYYKPMELLANCSGPARHVAVAQGMFDSDVPIKEGQRAITLLGGLPQCYDLTAYTPPEYCNTFTHHQEMWEFPDDMRKIMCKFWSSTFGTSEELCSGALPDYQLWSGPKPLPVGTPSLLS